MKRATREWLERWAASRSKMHLESGYSRDALDSEMRLKDGVRRKNATLREIRQAVCNCDPEGEGRCVTCVLICAALKPTRSRR